MIGNQDNLKQVKKSFFRRVFSLRNSCILLILAIGTGYYLKIENDKREASIDSLREFENIEAEIFDDGRGGVKDSRGNGSAKKFGDLTVEDLKGDDDFLYQVLIQNQLDLRKITSHMKLLEFELAKFKSQAKLQKLIMTYVNLRELIFTGKSYKNEMQSLRLLSIGNKVLTDEVRSLQENVQNFKNFDELNDELLKISKTLIAMKENDPQGGFLDKLRFNVAKIITVRKLDSKNDEVDGVIYRLEVALKDRDCSVALNEVEKFDDKYLDVIEGFKINLKNSCKLRSIDDDIMLYLENLSLVA